MADGSTGDRTEGAGDGPTLSGDASPAAPSAAHVSPGAEIGGYRIDALIGRGGMGVVYRATQISLEREVALKLIAPELAHDLDFRTRFQRESRTAASIEHPNVIPIYESGEAAGQVFISMRLVPGRDLGQIIAAEGALAPHRAARILGQVAAALDAAHQNGLVHRDVKPANVLVEASGGTETAYLTDFGLTRHVSSDSALTETGQWVGTVDYVSPEQVQGQPVDARTDVYSLGCVLYQALTGVIPFPRESQVAKIFAHVSDPIPLASDNGKALASFDGVIARALAKSPTDRFPSAGDLGRAAEAAAQGREPAGAERSVAKGAAAPKRRRSRPARIASAAAALLVVAAVATGVTMMATGQDSDPPTQTEGGQQVVPEGELFTSGIGPVRIGMTQSEVEELFGTPDKTQRVNLGGNLADPQEDWIWTYPDGRLRLSFATVGGSLQSYDTTSSQFETEAGAGIGDTEAEVRRLYGSIIRPAVIGSGLMVSEKTPGTYPALTFAFNGERVFAIGGGNVQPAGD